MRLSVLFREHSMMTPERERDCPERSGARHLASLARVDDGKEPVADGCEQSGRQHPIGNRGVRCPRHAPEIGAGPDELIPLGEDDPRGGSADTWVRLQTNYDLAQIRRRTTPLKVKK